MRDELQETGSYDYRRRLGTHGKGEVSWQSCCSRPNAQIRLIDGQDRLSAAGEEDCQRRQIEGGRDPKELAEGAAASLPKVTAALEDRQGRGAGVQDACWAVSVSPLAGWTAGN